MAWVQITEDDVLTRLAGAEVTAIKSSALANSQANPLPDVLLGVVRELRGRLQNKSTLESGDKIPDNWMPHCLAIIRYRLSSRLPGKIFWDEQRELEYSDAMRAFQQLGPILPEIPAVIDSTQYSNGLMKSGSVYRTYRFTQDDQDGLN